MSELSKQALKVENNQSFPNNNAGLITPTALRTFNEDMIDSTVNQATYTTDSASFDSRINNITGSTTDTGSLLTTASFDNGTRDLTFTKGDASQFSVNIPGQSGSVDWTEVTNKPSGLVSGSSQVVLEDTTFTDGSNDMFLSTDGAGNLSFDWVKTLHQNIHNAETSSILRGTPLFVSGATGDNANVYFADAGNPLRRPATLIAFDQTLGAGATGTGIISGEIQGVDTNLYPAGTVVYLGVGGGWSSTRPTGSASVQPLGVITRSANNGRGIVFNQVAVSLPNIQQGYAWVGDSNGVPQPIATSSFAVSIDTGSFATTGSNNFLGNQDVSGSVSSTINQSNTHLNPQTITDNVTILTGQNGIIIGNTSIAGDYTIEGDSEVYVFTPPVTQSIDTSTFATTGSNTFIGNQTITGSLNFSSSEDIFANSTEFNYTGDWLGTGTNITNNYSTGSFAIGRLTFNTNKFTIQDAGGLDFVSQVNVTFESLSNNIEFLGNAKFVNKARIDETLTLIPQTTLPAGTVGELATSGSNLYFHNGTNWTQIN
jgi:hypothetical protein